MLFINADDWGGWKAATDSAKECYCRERIHSVSAMVFMVDSARAADLAHGTPMPVGLHVNFTEPFNDANCPAELRRHQGRVARFLKMSKYALILFNPLLCESFRRLFAAQYDEFVRLYGRPPAHVDGHQHYHLCSNMLLQSIVPAGCRVRRSFSFTMWDKSWANRKYREWVDRRLAQHHPVTDYFFALSQNLQPERFEKILELAKTAQVELMTHPEKTPEYEFLLSDHFLNDRITH